MNVLDLFSGIGGFSLGLERAGFKTVAFCEIDAYCRRVLARHWPDVPIHNDIRELDGEQYRGTTELVCGGFPCQDISIAGKRAGLQGESSGLWLEMRRVIGEVGPRFVILENTASLTVRGLGDVLGDLADMGFDAEWHNIPAASIGANHLRARIWILAHPRGFGNRLQKDSILTRRRGVELCDWWASEPGVCRVDDGVPNRAHRLKALGNAVVPQIPEIIGRAILEAETTSPKDD